MAPPPTTAQDRSTASDDRELAAGVDEASARTSSLPSREALLFLNEDDLPLEQPSSVIDMAVDRVLERLDPLEQQGAVDDPTTGRRMLPGIVPLAPITIAAFLLNLAGGVTSVLFGLQYVPSYLPALVVFHGLVFGHIWTYYVAYRTRRRFLGFRQVSFTAALIAFVVWMMHDMIDHPPAVAAARSRLSGLYETYLWVDIALACLVAGLIVSHWAVLGRGYREVAAPRLKPTRRAPVDTDLEPLDQEP